MFYNSLSFPLDYYQNPHDINWTLCSSSFFYLKLYSYWIRAGSIFVLIYYKRLQNIFFSQFWWSQFFWLLIVLAFQKREN